MPSISLPTAILAAGVIGGGAALVSGGKAAGAAKSAAQIQSDAATQAAQLQQQRYEQTRSDLSPFVAFGQGQIPSLEANISNLNSLLPGGNSPAFAAVQNLLGIGPGGQIDPVKRQAALEATPGYQFTRDQGLKSLQNSFAAQGLGRSGAALKGAAAFTTGLADQTYEQQLQNYVSNWQSQFTNTQSAVNTGINSVAQGANAGAQVGSIGVQSGQTQGNFATSGAAAQAGGIVGGTNALTSGLTGAAGAISNTLLPSALLGGGFTPNGWTAPNSGIYGGSSPAPYGGGNVPASLTFGPGGV